MLVIRRRQGEGIQIGSNITVHVLDLSPGRVKLGIEAPQSLCVLRLEVVLSAVSNQQAASTSLSPEKAARLAERLRRPLDEGAPLEAS